MASLSDISMELTNGLLWAKAINQRIESPWGGKVKYSPALKAAMTTIISGNKMKVYMSTNIAL